MNLLIPHAFYYSIEGARKYEHPPDVGPSSLWWPHYGILATYMQRVSFLMSDISLHAPVAVLCRNQELAADQVRVLYENQIGLRYLPQSEWANCRVVGNALVHGEHVFQAVVGDVGGF